MRIRISQKPREPELDGVRLDRFECGKVYDASASIGSWLIAQGYAQPEMRREHSRDDLASSTITDRGLAPDHRSRRWNDR